MQDILFNTFVDNTFSSIPERGIHLCLQKLDKDLRSCPEETKYYKEVILSDKNKRNNEKST